ncbi:diacylglycerol/lipid kinase family protein [Cellulomonas bogoriensis]|uniref:Sphingosine kinase n=1 Tax=Cellulomonas bogoriensis 69B4 = DSM 16987 TaxID=1386082 RepID=A0A0A0BPJ9_9CELL|nr:diacylglycerol kinase family protein [Cellulomonas bogoriensis]KGM09851.1 sphingosine kinase [Cellulomonas bogoriensis 69B4 = DSM 16987]
MGLRLAVLVNPTSGSGRGARQGARTVDLLRRRGHLVRTVSAPDRVGAGLRAAEVVADGVDALVVVGGDGTVGLGVGAVAGTAVPLGVVAAGSGNDVARSLGLPRHDPVRAVRHLESAFAAGGRLVDAMTVAAADGSGERWCMGVVSAGVDAAVNARANASSWPRGRARYVRALAAELPGFRPYGYRLRLDDGTWEPPATLVAVANTTSIGGGMRIAPDACADDGLLDVVVAGPLSRTALLRIFPSVYRGAHVHHPVCEVRRSRTVLLEPAPSEGLRHPPTAFADGEPVGQVPLLVRVRPGALTLLA